MRAGRNDCKDDRESAGKRSSARDVGIDLGHRTPTSNNRAGARGGMGSGGNGTGSGHH